MTQIVLTAVTTLLVMAMLNLLATVGDIWAWIDVIAVSAEDTLSAGIGCMADAARGGSGC